ncbi:MAG: hydroxyacylglutathione hydrolase [Hyphomonadaceae bacterium]
MLQIHQFPCLKDNYGFLVHDDESGETASIDTPEAARILSEADAKGWKITQIWNTHWHNDHAGGNADIRARTGAVVSGPAEVERLGTAPDRVVREGDVVRLGRHQARVLAVGGHTLGHVAYVLDAEKTAFVGDTLFALGCGRLFEGTPQQMWESLSKLAGLPDDTTLYCAHEYTQANARFALSVDADNPALQKRSAEIDALRAAGKPTVPMTLAQEKAANPFLRAPALKAKIGLAGAPDWEAFGAIRKLKDDFK